MQTDKAMTWQDEAREAVRKEWWTWVSGMLPVHPDKYGFFPDGGSKHRSNRWELGDGALSTYWWFPDLEDAATVGCLRAEVERLCVERCLVVSFYRQGEWSHCWVRADVDAEEPRDDWPEEDECVHDSRDPASGAGLVALRALTWLHEAKQ